MSCVCENLALGQCAKYSMCYVSMDFITPRGPSQYYFYVKIVVRFKCLVWLGFQLKIILGIKVLGRRKSLILLNQKDKLN